MTGDEAPSARVEFELLTAVWRLCVEPVEAAGDQRLSVGYWVDV